MALLLGLFLTIALYGAFPLLYSLLHKGSIRKAHFRNLCICYGVSIYLALFLFAEFYSGEPGTFFPAILWTTLWYKVCCGILSAKGRLDAPTEPISAAPTITDISDIPCEVVEEYHSDYKVPSSATPPPNAAFTIQPPKPQPSPEAPAMPRKALCGTPVWNWVVIGVLSLSCCALAFTTFSAHQRIGELEETVELKAGTLSVLRKQNDTYKATIDKYKTKAELFDDLRQALSGGNLGYASSNFRASKSVFFLTTDSDPEEFTLTTTYSGGGTVNLDASPSSVTHVVFNEDTWYSSTTLTIYPIKAGIATFTFSNTVNSQTFKIVVVVTD